MKKFSTIGFKIMISTILVSLLVLAITVLGFQVGFNKTMQVLLDKNIKQGENFVFGLLDDQRQESLSLARQYGNYAPLVQAFLSNDREKVAQIISPIFKLLEKNNSITIFEIGNGNGTVYMRAHNIQKFGDDKSSDAAISATLGGKETSGFIFGASGIAIRAIVPIKEGNSIVGTFQIGMNLNQALLMNLSRLVGNLAFYQKDVLIQSTLAEEKDMINKKNEKDIFDRLVNKEQTVVVEKENMQSKFFPIQHPVDQSVVGMIRLDQDTQFIAQRKNESNIIVTSITALAIMLASLISFFTSRLITRPIKETILVLKNISEGNGDLTIQISATSKDEIGDMAKYFNLTFEKIRNLVTMVKEQSGFLQNVGTNLSSSMNETAAAINQITANIQSIKNQSLNQSASVAQTSAAMEQITKGIERLSRLIEDQSANVTESSSAIEEMMANIGSVTQTLVKNSANIKSLMESSESGKGVLDKISVAIRDVAKESEGLLEISNVIQKIASQTNLLSMNAAIEAAHAGDSGRGFAVVADEIRKLAETSSEQTITIATVLKRIKDSIEGITLYSEEVITQFSVIDTEVRTVGEQESGILRAMEEQSEGSKQILEAITILNDITQQVQASSMEMLDGSKQVLKEAVNMNAMTQEIASGMNEMSIGTDQISVAVNQVNELSVDNKTSIDALIGEVDKFKV